MTNHIDALLERVRGASGPSSLIDAEIYATLGGAPHTTTVGNRTIPLVLKGDPDVWPSYTASIDAALALVATALPEANCTGYDNMTSGVTTYLSKNDVPSGHWYFGGAHATSIPLAILTALLTALQSQDPK